MYSKFSLIIQNLYDKSFPLISKTIKNNEKRLPWITKAIKKSIARKHILYKKFLKTRSDESHSVYKTYRNKLTAILRKSEKCITYKN